jgi:hypothetical protein
VMSVEDTRGQEAGTRFAGDLRRQFEALGERAQEPRKRRRVVVGAVVVGVAVAIMIGSIALASGFDSDRPQASAARPQAPPATLRPATSVYPTNANGQTYGPNLHATPMVEEPDLMAVVATNGKDGYCLRTDLEGPVPKTPQEALSQQAAQAGKDQVIPVYESDGTTQIGVFISGH